MYAPAIRKPSLLIEVDYTTEPHECFDCGGIEDRHNVDCQTIMRNWVGLLSDEVEPTATVYWPYKLM